MNSNQVKTTTGVFNASVNAGYVMSNERYFQDSFKRELKTIEDNNTVIYRLDETDGFININRVNYKYIYAQVDVKRQSVWFFGTRADDKDALSTSAREKLQSVNHKALISHAIKHIQALKNNAKDRLFSSAEKHITQSFIELQSKQDFLNTVRN